MKVNVYFRKINAIPPFLIWQEKGSEREIEIFLLVFVVYKIYLHRLSVLCFMWLRRLIYKLPSVYVNSQNEKIW